MFGTGLLKGLGITLKHFTDTFADDRRKEPARYEGSIQIDDRRRVIDQPITQEGLLTIQYPEERRLLPERFRYIPMLIWDTEVGEDRCTACGICAKVCPPSVSGSCATWTTTANPSRALQNFISTSLSV